MTTSVMIYNFGPGVLEVAARDRDEDGRFLPQGDPVRVAPGSYHIPAVWTTRDLILESSGTEFLLVSLDGVQREISISKSGKNEQGMFETRLVSYYRGGEHDKHVLFSGEHVIIEEEHIIEED